MTQRKWLRATGLLSALAWSLSAAMAAPGVPEARQLANGLTVISLEDHALPLVAVSLWVHVGSKDEIDTSAGYAHFLEHLLQRGTDTTGPFEFQRRSQRWGGSFSVRSNYDRTAITLTGVPAVLPEMLEAAAGLAFRATLKDSEIDLELGILNQEIHNYYDMPSSVIYLETLRQTFPGHPYRTPMLGNFRTLGTLKHDALASFYKNLYVPNNMSLALGGDFNPKQAAAMVDASFGKAAKSGTLAPKPPAPAAFPTHTDVEKRSDVKESWTALSFAVPGYRNPDRPALEIIARALGDYGGAPLSQAVLRDRTGNAARVALPILEDAGMLYVAISPATPELAYGAATSALRELTAFKKRGLKEAEVRSIAARIVREERVRSASLAEKISSLAEASLFGGLRYYWDLPDLYRRVTPEAVAEVAARLLVSDNLKLVILVPKQTAPFTDQAKAEFHAALDELGAAPAGSSPGFERVLYPAEDKGRVTAAAWGDPRDAAGLRPPETQTLSNGLTLIVQEDHRTALAALSLQITSGSASDPPGKEGLASLVGRLIGTRGTNAAADPAPGAKPATGGRIGSLPQIQVSRDLTEVRLSIDPEELRDGLSWMAAAVRKAATDDAAFAAARKTGLDLLQRGVVDPSSAGLDLFHEKVYAGHPYAQGGAGTAASLQALTKDDLASQISRTLRPSRMTIAVAGDVAAASVFKLGRELFGDWKEPASRVDATRDAAQPPPAATSGARAGEFTRSVAASQSHVLVGVPGVPLRDPSFNMVRFLGAALTLRGFEEIVFQRRAAFSVTAIPEGFKEGGALALEVVATAPRRDEAVFDLQQLMRRLALEELPQDEIEALARMQAGRETTAVQSLEGLASTLSYREATGLRASSYRQLFATTGLPTPASLREAAERILRPEALIIIKVGPAND